MRRNLAAAAAVVGLLSALAWLLGHADMRGDDPPKLPPLKRTPWTTSKVRGSPDPPNPYALEVGFPKLKFDEPLDITTAKGTDRLFVTERFGRIYSFPNDPKVEKADLLIDLNRVFGKKTPRTLAAYGFAAHPQFAKNGFVYITIVPDATKEEPRGTRVSRFTAKGDPPVCDPNSEVVIIEWPSGGHNGGALEFGPDGMLFIATGDASGIADQLLTGQDMTTLAGKILRIDVDRHDSSQRYGIPPDNPFVGRPNMRAEIYAYGLRQPWKFSFDLKSGDLWCGNVGQDLWEQIYRIEKGGNYGWSILEGSHPFRPERPRGPTPILMPVVEHDHANFRSVTGGYVYHGTRLKELTGAYIYGDYDTGRIWMFRYDRVKNSVAEHRELLDSTLRLIDFAEDSAGELHLADHITGRIYRLVPNPAANTADKFPRKLSETGLFSSTKEHQVAPGVLPYSVIAPQWCDGATKERFIAAPGSSRIEFDGMLYPNAANAPPGWKFPDGAVVAETIFLEMEAGNPASRRRIETRILHHERLTGTEEVGDQYWQGYTYIWNDEQTDAVLLEDPQGRDRTFDIRDAKAPDGRRRQTWHFPSRTECMVCHNMAAKYVVGMQTLQMNCNVAYDGVRANQLAIFERLGLFTNPLPSPPEDLPRIVDYRDASQDLNLRARSYLHANCSHCHRRWGGGNAEFQLLATFDLHDTGTLGVRPGQGTFNIPHAKLIAPGDPFRSVLFYRMSTIGAGRMPRLGSGVIDEAGVKLIHDWIAAMPGGGLTTERLLQERARELQVVDSLRLHSDPDKPDSIHRDTDRLLQSPASALRLAHRLDEINHQDKSKTRRIHEAIVARAVQSDSPEIRDLFERYLPEEKRIKRLGAVVKAEQILAIPGDVERGRKLFFESQATQCRNCHRIGGQGRDLGPDLDGIGKKYDRGKILENILQPSKEIDPKFLTYLVETKQGRAFSGLLVSRDGAKIVLKDSESKILEVRAADVEVFVAQQKSLMPELLLRDMTAEQVADLTAFLASLRD